MLNSKNKVVLIVAAILIIIAIIIFFTGKKVDAPVVPISPTPPATTTDQNGVTPPGVIPDSDFHSAIDECIALKQNDAKGKGEFLKGTLLVGFPRGVTLNEVIKIIAEYKLSLVPTETDIAEKNLKDYGWLAVEVPRGEEYRWQCILEADTRVRNARLNFILDFHE